MRPKPCKSFRQLGQSSRASIPIVDTSFCIRNGENQLAQQVISPTHGALPRRALRFVHCSGWLARRRQALGSPLPSTEKNWTSPVRSAPSSVAGSQRGARDHHLCPAVSLSRATVALNCIAPTTHVPTSVAASVLAWSAPTSRFGTLLRAAAPLRAISGLRARANRNACGAAWWDARLRNGPQPRRRSLWSSPECGSHWAEPSRRETASSRRC